MGFNGVLLPRINDGFVTDGVENIMGRGETAGQPAFTPFSNMLSKGFFLEACKNARWWARGLIAFGKAKLLIVKFTLHVFEISCSYL